MAKRFIDTDIFKKQFIRSLEAPYKLLWVYLINDCNHAGIWEVDFDVAEIRIGLKIDREKSKKVFEGKISVLNGGSKWFLPDFIDFQYGDLKENNRAHLSVISILKKENLLNEDLSIKPLISPLHGRKDMDMDKEKDKEEEKEEKKSFPWKEILFYLNEKTKKSFREVDSNRDIILARSNEGYKLEDFKKIVDNKIGWLGDIEMDKFLRPETLFARKHFESYLNEKPETSTVIKSTSSLADFEIKRTQPNY